MADIKLLIARGLSFATVPWLVVFLALLLWWPSLYLLFPLLIPFSAYAHPQNGWISEASASWPIHVCYLTAVAVVATWAGRRMKTAKSVGVFLGLAVLAAVTVHMLMITFGYTYWYDGP